MFIPINLSTPQVHRLLSKKIMQAMGNKYGVQHCFWCLLLIVIVFIPIHLRTASHLQRLALSPQPQVDRCAGRYIYVHELPSRFNTDLLRDCRSLNCWVDMCPAIANSGLGLAISDDSEGVLSDNGWYETNQFSLEIIFHNRMKHYDCLTADSSRAAAIFVPFYVGLGVGRHLWGGNTSVRDKDSLELVRWLRARPEWRRMGGRDHFLVAGRITWDFRRMTESGWGATFLNLPEARNMSTLIIESSPWGDGSDFAIPYPTYFHPLKSSHLVSWQEKVRVVNRPWLFAFAGGPRPNQTCSIRTAIIEQCRKSRRCRLLDCGSNAKGCYSAKSIMQLFESSVFCLQPPGDSYTRRSTFDAMAAGCVPVFFHPASAYLQYGWHLPKNHSEYSAFIPEDQVKDGKVNIEEFLSGLSDEQVSKMREEVIKMMPRLIYGDPRARLDGWKDAFDVSVERVIEMIERLRREMKEGLAPASAEKERWQSALMGDVGENMRDYYFQNYSS